MERAEIWISSDIYIPIGSYGDSFIKGWVINCIASHPDLIQYFFSDWYPKRRSQYSGFRYMVAQTPAELSSKVKDDCAEACARKNSAKNIGKMIF